MICFPSSFGHGTGGRLIKSILNRFLMKPSKTAAAWCICLATRCVETRVKHFFYFGIPSRISITPTVPLKNPYAEDPFDGS